MKVFFLCIVGILSGIVVMSFLDPSEVIDPNSEFTYIITGTGPAQSLDPLDADQTINLPIARMRYLTPVEIGPNDNLVSGILENFKYNNETREMRWQVKKGVLFSDGTEITPQDVALTITRMVLHRPGFPVLRNIVGLESWLNNKHPLKTLPAGLKISDQEITIKFTQQSSHPLFRFALELFSIIPTHCIDLKTSKLTCDIPPASGYYQEVEGALDQENWLFSRRKDSSLIHGQKYPKLIRFKYKYRTPDDEVLSELKEKVVISGSDKKLSSPEFKAIEDSTEVKYLPKSRFSVLLLNPNQGAFRNKQCRKLYANAFRKVYAETLDRESTRSIFPKILPGHISDEEMEQLSPQINEEECLRQLRNDPPAWMHFPKGYALFDQITEKTFEYLGIKAPTPVIDKTAKSRREKFGTGEIQIDGAGMGFWPIDPAGDLQMMFTPGLHAGYQFINADAELQSLIEQLQNETSSEKRTTLYRKINLHIYDEALYNITIPFGRFFLALKGQSLEDTPAAITTSTPWQVFPLD